MTCMKNIKKIFLFFIIFSILVLPALSLAAGLVPCNNTPSANGATISNPCDFTALMTLISKVINFILYDLAIPIAAIMFFYAGFKMVTSGGSTEAKGQAKTIFTHTALGLVFIASAWLIIKMILSILGFPGAWIGF